MNWVGGARNRLKLKHENKLQKEFFERKRQSKGNTRIGPSVTKKVNKATGIGSQDLFSLEVIMSAHKKDVKQRKADRVHTSQKHGDGANSENLHRQDAGPTKQRQHILPELSPVRHQLPAVNFDEGSCGSFCADQQECVFTSMPSGRPMDNHQKAMANRQALSLTEAEELGAWGTAFELGTAMLRTKLK